MNTISRNQTRRCSSKTVVMRHLTHGPNIFKFIILEIVSFQSNILVILCVFFLHKTFYFLLPTASTDLLIPLPIWNRYTTAEVPSAKYHVCMEDGSGNGRKLGIWVEDHQLLELARPASDINEIKPQKS